VQRRGAIRTHRALLAALAVLAFACGVLAVGWKHDHDRATCWRDIAEDGAAPEGDCDR